MKNAIIKKFITWVTSKEIYVWEEFFTEKESDDEYPEIIEINPPKWGGGDGRPIRIDEVLDILTKLKEEGCSHVEMTWHCDHLEYEFHGYELRKATPEEAEAETKRQEVAINKMMRGKIE